MSNEIRIETSINKRIGTTAGSIPLSLLNHFSPPPFLYLGHIKNRKELRGKFIQHYFKLQALMNTI